MNWSLFWRVLKKSRDAGVENPTQKHPPQGPKGRKEIMNFMDKPFVSLQ